MARIVGRSTRDGNLRAGDRSYSAAEYPGRGRRRGSARSMLGATVNAAVLPTRPRVLLLEDDPAIARTVAFALEREGLAVQHVLLVGDALAVLARQAVDVLVLDVGLPDGNGIDLCRALRQSAETRQRTLPVQLALLALMMALVPLTQGNPIAVNAVFFAWGVAGFGMMAPQQSRLAELAPIDTVEHDRARIEPARHVARCLGRRDAALHPRRPLGGEPARERRRRALGRHQHHGR